MRLKVLKEAAQATPGYLALGGEGHHDDGDARPLVTRDALAILAQVEQHHVVVTHTAQLVRETSGDAVQAAVLRAVKDGGEDVERGAQAA